MRVLVVDDDEIARETMRQLLERAACEVTAVENAIAGLAELHRTTFDAIVCDYRLPFMGGGTFFEEVRLEQPDTARRFIFVTGYASNVEIAEALEATGQPVMRKPFDVDDFVKAVRAMGPSSPPA